MPGPRPPDLVTRSPPESLRTAIRGPSPRSVVVCPSGPGHPGEPGPRLPDRRVHGLHCRLQVAVVEGPPLERAGTRQRRRRQDLGRHLHHGRHLARPAPPPPGQRPARRRRRLSQWREAREAEQAAAVAGGPPPPRPPFKPDAEKTGPFFFAPVTEAAAARP